MPVEGKDLHQALPANGHTSQHARFTQRAFRENNHTICQARNKYLLGPAFTRFSSHSRIHGTAALLQVEECLAASIGVGVSFGDEAHIVAPTVYCGYL